MVILICLRLMGSALHDPYCLHPNLRMFTPISLWALSGNKVYFHFQTFLCVMGSVISVAICIWLAAFSREPGWRRAVFATGAALCAVMFAFLAFMTIRRAKHPPEPEALPDLSQRRSTIGARVSKKSIAAAGLTGGGGDDCPTQV